LRQWFTLSLFVIFHLGALANIELARPLGAFRHKTRARLCAGRLVLFASYAGRQIAVRRRRENNKRPLHIVHTGLHLRQRWARYERKNENNVTHGYGSLVAPTGIFNSRLCSFLASTSAMNSGHRSF
jgi:hypothetical protein